MLQSSPRQTCRGEGIGHDLAMATAILVASGQLEADLGRIALIGELALDGSLRPIPAPWRSSRLVAYEP